MDLLPQKEQDTTANDDYIKCPIKYTLNKIKYHCKHSIKHLEHFNVGGLLPFVHLLNSDAKVSIFSEPTKFF